MEGEVVMAGINYIDNSTPTYTGTGNAGTGANTVDGSDSTSWQSYSIQAGGGTTTNTLLSDHDFGRTRIVTSIKFKATCSCATSSGASANLASSTVVFKYYDGTWNSITGDDATAINISSSCGGDESDSDSVDVSRTLTTPLSCSKVRMEIYTYAYQNGDNGAQNSTADGFELEAYGSGGDYVQII